MVAAAAVAVRWVVVAMICSRVRSAATVARVAVARAAVERAAVATAAAAWAAAAWAVAAMAMAATAVAATVEAMEVVAAAARGAAVADLGPPVVATAAEKVASAGARAEALAGRWAGTPQLTRRLRAG